MPIKYRLERRLPPAANALIRKLVEEWTRPKRKGQPIIVLEGKKGHPQHIYVIWDDWEGLDQLERSEIIMDAVEQLGDKKVLEDLSLVAVAMGLTTKEAKRMGIEAA
jgi:hypothetical protein